jgi:hypothetical protein
MIGASATMPLISRRPAMTRLASVVLSAFAVAFVVAVADVPAPALAQQQDLMRCMEQCLRHEGRDQKETCKLRCADIPSVTGPGSRPPGQQDCMGQYKACQRDCGKDRECHKACKTQLMNCK